MFAIAASALMFVLGAVLYVAQMTDSRLSAYATRLYVSPERADGLKYYALVMGTMLAACGGLMLTVISTCAVVGA